MLDKPPPLHEARFRLLGGLPKPDFLVIGAAKAGTTSLSSYLSHHQSVEPVTFKEPNFFTWQLMARERYQGLFVNKRRRQGQARIAGDYSTSYLLHPLAPRRIAERLPDIKCIMLLRNPTDRAYSHYIMQQRQGVETEAEFAEIVEREILESTALLAAHRRGFFDTQVNSGSHRQDEEGRPLAVRLHDHAGTSYLLDSEERLFQYYVTSYVLRSIYADQVERWMTLFPPEQLLTIEAERFFSQRYDVLDEITDFLEIPRRDRDGQSLDYSLGGGASNSVEEAGAYTPLSAEVRSHLDAFFHPHNQRLAKLCGKEFSWT